MTLVDEIYVEAEAHPFSINPNDMKCHFSALRDRAATAERIIELGVRWGNSTVCFLKGLQESGGWLWSCDIEEPSGYAARLRGELNWQFYLGTDLADEALKKAPAWCDLLFIDTMHTYDHTIAELTLWSPKVDEGGLILMHDTRSQGVEVAGSLAPRSEVYSAIETFLAKEPKHKWFFSEVPECFGMGTLERRF